MADERFPIQHGPSVPWEFMVPHDAQCKKNHSGQSLQHIAGRGGLGATEAWCCVNGLALWPTHDTKEGTAAARQKWFELAERVNREWSVKQARAEVLAACIKHFETEAEGCSDYANEEAGEARAAWNREEERFQNCADDLRNLQPTAKDLEELLRKAELKGRLEEYRYVHGNSLLGGPCCTMDCRGCEHIRELERELERARAIEGKG